MMKEDPDFTFEMEQTLNLMEFLEAHPERKGEVELRYKEGRFNLGLGHMSIIQPTVTRARSRGSCLRTARVSA